MNYYKNVDKTSKKFEKTSQKLWKSVGKSQGNYRKN